MKVVTPGAQLQLPGGVCKLLLDEMPGQTAHLVGAVVFLCPQETQVWTFNPHWVVSGSWEFNPTVVFRGGALGDRGLIRATEEPL